MSSQGAYGVRSRQEAGDERLELAHRIAASGSFRRAQRLREFLIYVVERSVAGDMSALGEQQIGRAVFHRPADYSPGEDNVVRVHARQLRLKLGEYFETEGKLERLLLEIPKGSYVPVFAPRPVVARPADEQPAGSPHPTRPSPASLAPWLVAAAAVILAATLAIDRQLHRPVPAAKPAVAEAPPIPIPLAWALDGRKTSIVVADSCFGLAQDIAGRTLGLEQYLNPEFLVKLRPSGKAGELESLLRRVRSRELTSYADLMLSTGILRLAGRLRDSISVRFARDLNPRDLKSGNFIFLGSPYTNPWVGLFDVRRNFRIDFDRATQRGYAVNKHPRANEQATYTVEGENGNPGDTIGILTFLPANTETGNVLIVEGANMEGTEGAGQRLIDPKAARELLSSIGMREPGAAPRYLEVLLVTKALAGAPSETRVAAWRK